MMFLILRCCILEHLHSPNDFNHNSDNKFPDY
jgi:hypothetical protein